MALRQQKGEQEEITQNLDTALTNLKNVINQIVANSGHKAVIEELVSSIASTIESVTSLQSGSNEAVVANAQQILQEIQGSGLFAASGIERDQTESEMG